MKHESAYSLSVDEALEMFGEKADESLIKELTSLDKKEVFEQVLLASLTKEQRRAIIRSRMFLKEKFLSTGIFDKLKARYVAGGHMQNRELYTEEETSSPTIALQSVYMIASIAAREKRKVYTMDIGTAYLNAKMGKEVLMRIEPKLAKILSKINPSKYAIENDGTIIVRLLRALYGCLESAKLWYDKLTGIFKKLGFKPNRRDPCVFNRLRNGKQVTVGLFVDDILSTCEDESNLQWLAQSLIDEFKDVTINRGIVHSYLGQTFDFGVDGQVTISMEGYIRDALDESGVTGHRVTPAKDNLFDVDDGSPALTTEQAIKFHSRVMKLFYLAQRARPDILTAMNFLSTRVSKSTAEDWEKLERVYMYLNSTADIKMVIRPHEKWQVLAYVDASFAVHPGAKSQSGMVISLGQGVVHASSKKQKLVGKSSTEAELIAVSDMLPQVIWTREFLMEQGYEVKPVMLQDNQSTMALIEKGRSTSARTRHIGIRYFFVKDRVDSGELSIEYEPTMTMLADCMTKPLQGDLFRDMREMLMGGRDLPVRGALKLSAGAAATNRQGGTKDGGETVHRAGATGSVGV